MPTGQREWRWRAWNKAAAALHSVKQIQSSRGLQGGQRLRRGKAVNGRSLSLCEVVQNATGVQILFRRVASTDTSAKSVA